MSCPKDQEKNRDISDLKAKALEKLLKAGFKNQGIKKQREDKPAILSRAQRRLWFLEQLTPGNISYNMPFAVKFKGNLNIEILKKSIKVLLDRHETLRTIFPLVNGEPVQFVQQEYSNELEEIEVEGLNKNEKNLNASKIMQEESLKAFNIDKGPLIKFILLKIEKDENILFINMHHIISDGWSCGVFIREFEAIYKSIRNDDKFNLKPLPIQYRDYTYWQKEWLKGDIANKQLSFWQDRLGGDLPNLLPPVSDAHLEVPTYKGDRVYFNISNELKDRLKQFCINNGVTPFMVLISIYYILLYRYSGQEDIIIGTPVANRKRLELENLIGFFVNTLALRVNLSGNPMYKDFLKNVSEVSLDAFDNQDLPFEILVEKLNLQRDLSKNPIFQTMFVFQNTDNPSVSFEDLSMEVEYIYNNTSKFDLLLTMYEENDGICGAFEYNCDIFTQKTIERMAVHFVNLLESALNDPFCTIGTLPLLSQEEKDVIIHEFNNTKVNYESETLLHKLFEEQVKKAPNNIALIYEKEVLSYNDLNCRANQIARFLKKKGVGPDQLVGVYMKRSIDMVLAIYGIVKAGGAYVPLDPDYPAERVKFMMEDADTQIILTQSEIDNRLPISSSEIVCLDKVKDEINNEDIENLEVSITGDNLAYMIFTSGSTGRPKGVMNVHKAICNRLIWMQEEYKLDEQDKVLQKTPFSFDVSVWEFFWPLITGASLVIAQPDGHKDSLYLINTVKDYGITTMHFVPSMLQIFLQEKSVTECTSLKRVICSGEALTYQLRELFFQKLKCQLHNLYGPTEAAIDVTYWDCSRDNGKKIVPIGFPIANIKIHILDKFLQPVPIGVPGELHIGGIGLARGYYKRTELTNEKFIRDPFSDNPEDRLYKTGDLARYLDDGSIEYLGRIDFQVKLRGQRIELGEIEAVLELIPEVSKAVVTVCGDEHRLIAYIVPAINERNFDESKLREFLEKKLPPYMIPNEFVYLEYIPLSPNGKVDRKALPVPKQRTRSVSNTFVSPRTPTEIAVSEIFTEVLGIENIGIKDSFFELGGHSLLATKLVFKIQEKFDLNYNVRTFFTEPTIEGVSKTIEKFKNEKSGDAEQNIDLSKEVILDEDIINSINKLKNSYSASGNGAILLTGATGFLGIFLLNSLLENTDSDIYCLVRAKNDDAAKERIAKALKEYEIANVAWERIKPIAGDLEKPLLGLSNERFYELSSKINTIYHNGAFVNFVYPYNTLKAANVNGTIEVIRLASNVKLKPVNYISTLHVFSSDDFKKYGSPQEIDEPIHWEAIKLGYAQSKWVAEKIVKKAHEAGIPTKIFRLGRISGHSITGVCQKNDFLWRMIKSCIQMGIGPKVDMPIDIVPVDNVADSIVKLARNREIRETVFHIFNKKPSTLCELTSWMDKKGYSIKLVPYNLWYETLFSKRNEMEENAAFSLLPFLKELSSTENVMPSFRAERTETLLKNENLSYPCIDEKIFDIYFKYFERINFFEVQKGMRKSE